jgi:hypothetical protein
MLEEIKEREKYYAEFLATDGMSPSVGQKFNLKDIIKHMFETLILIEKVLSEIDTLTKELKDKVDKLEKAK